MVIRPMSGTRPTDRRRIPPSDTNRWVSEPTEAPGNLSGDPRVVRPLVVGLSSFVSFDPSGSAMTQRARTSQRRHRSWDGDGANPVAAGS